ncbi:hypothetical protein MHTCC0001_19920 [Flavobacteriaceae bacterium MHTCC 0001]
MAIEIKEFVVKVVVEESAKQTEVLPKQAKQNLEQFKTELIKKCTREVLQILKEKQER